MENAINGFTLNLYKNLSENDENQFMSPYSISAALMLTMLGTQGESHKQIQQTLEVADISDPHQAYKKLNEILLGKSNSGVKLNIAHRIFFRMGTEIKELYKKELQNYYNSELELLDFIKNPEESRTRINTWVENQTNNKIMDLIQAGGINPNTLTVLISAIYFKGDWKFPFDTSDTKSKPFQISETESSMVEMMRLDMELLKIGMSESLDCQILDLPYKGKDLSMLIVLPNRIEGLSSLESKLSTDTFQDLTQNMHYEDVIAHIPKFKIESSFHLVEVLNRLGIRDIFSEKADFGAMMENPSDDTSVSDIIHKAFIEVNEKGTEAVAVTGIDMCDGPSMPIVFKADHPFLFLIRENSTGTILFIGHFIKPSN